MLLRDSSLIKKSTEFVVLYGKLELGSDTVAVDETDL